MCFPYQLFIRCDLPGLHRLREHHLQDQVRAAGGEGVRVRQAARLQVHQRLLREHRLPMLMLIKSFL